jgi:hypothetical protein
MKKNLRRNWDPSYGFLSPQPRNRNTARGQDWGRAGGEEGTASPAPSSYSDRCSPSLSARSAALPDWNRNLVTGRESHIPLLLTSNIVHRQQQQRGQQQLRNGGVGAETSHSWHRGGVPATATDNDCNRNGDSNLNCRVSSADPNRNIYRAGGEGDNNTLRFSTTASNRLVSDVEENYYQTIRTPQSDKKGAQQPRPLPHHHRHQQVQLSDVYQSVISSPDKSTLSSSGRLSSDYQAVSSSSPLAAARGQQQQQRLFASPRRKDGPTPMAHSNIPVLLNRPWTAASAALAASASGSSSGAASPRHAATAGEQRTIGGGQLEPAAVQRTKLTEGRIYGTGGSDKTTYNRGPVGMGCSYNPVNRNMYNLNTGRASLLASPSRYTDSS